MFVFDIDIQFNKENETFSFDKATARSSDSNNTKVMKNNVKKYILLSEWIEREKWLEGEAGLPKHG